MIQSKNIQLEPRLQIGRSLNSAVETVVTIKNNSQAQLEKLFENLKRVLVKSIDKAMKRIGGELNGQFDRISHCMGMFSNELASDAKISQARLSAMGRYANKLMGESKKVQNQLERVQEKTEAMCKVASEDIKQLQCSRVADTEFNENVSLVVRKNFQFDSPVTGLCYIRDRLAVYGQEFWKIQGIDRQICRDALKLLKPVRVHTQQYVLRVHEGCLVVSTSKDAKVLKIEGDFRETINAVQIQETLFVVGSGWIHKLNIYTGRTSYHKINGTVSACASTNYRGMLALLVGKELRLYNTQCQCVYSKVVADQTGIAAASNLLVLWNDQFLQILDGMEIRVRKPIQGVRSVSEIGIDQLFILSKSSVVISLRSFQISPACFKQPGKKQPLICASNRNEMHVLYENNTVKELTIE